MADATPPTAGTDLRALQDGLSASLQTVHAAYDQCEDPAQSLALLANVRDLTAQMSAIETALFHEQTVAATAQVTDAFSCATGFTKQLKDLSGQLEKAADIVNAAAKLVGAVAQILPYL